VHWSGVEVRRFRGTLYLTGVEAPAPDAELVWDGRSPLPLPGGGTLHAEPGRAGLDPAAWADAPLRVRFRRGGERCRPRGRAHSQSLKRLFQERDVPPWVRARVPLVYAGDRLAAVGDLWVCEPFFTEAPLGVALRWER
jgi:tRNA(Ile)-lysidine synthase